VEATGLRDPGDRPGVVALPPLIYLAGLIAGYVVNAFVPWRLALPPAVRWAGGVMMLGAVALAVIARTSFARAHTAANPMESATTLVTSGVFRWSRNPMYVGMTALVGGLGLATRIAWILIVLVPVLAIMHWGVVLREERYLARTFGADYERYRSGVRRYL
jgi:protein-S-isoprenylcysteine O-methyltransferase Ste14